MKIKADKWKHFFVGLVMGLILQALGSIFLPGHNIIVAGIAFFLIVLVGYGFELFSKFSGWGHYDFMDAVATVIGGVVGMGALLWL